MKDLIKKILRESDFDWVDEVEYEPMVGDAFNVKGTRYVWSLYDIIKGSERDGYQFKITPHPGRGVMSDWQTISLDSIKYHLDTGNWIPIKISGEKIKENLKESDFDWIEEVTPFDFSGVELWLETDKEWARTVVEKLKEIGAIQKHAFNYEFTTVPSGIKYIILHCGMDYNDYKPVEGEFCFSRKGPEEDEEIAGEYIELKKDQYWDYFF